MDIKEIIFNLLQQIFPNEKILKIKEFNEGYNNLAFDIKLESREVVFKKIKLLDEKKLGLKQEKIRTLIQTKYMNFPIAKILYSDFSKKIVDFSYIIIEKIPGTSLKESFDKIKNKKEIFEKYGELYGMFHSFKFDEYSELDSYLIPKNSFSNWFENKCIIIEKIFEKIKLNNSLDEEEININWIFYLKYRNLLKLETKPCLCHGDASNTNIIVNKINWKKFEINGIIDFEFTRVGGAIEDLFAGFEFSEQKFEYKEDLIKGYLKYSDLPKNWEQLFYFYQWFKNLNRISNLPNLSWRQLNKKETIERKKLMKNKCLASLKEIRDIFSKSNVLNLDFLYNWKNLKDLEGNGIQILKEGIDIIFKEIPKENIIAIYLKGSFSRREMNKGSDVDVGVIVNSDFALKKLNELQIEYRESKKLNFEFSGYSITELKTGKLSDFGKSKRPGPGRFVRLIPSYILIYGEPLDINELSRKSDLEYLRNVIKLFYNLFFPNYEKGDLTFEHFLKQLLWLIELEVSVKNQHFRFSTWSDLVNHCEKNHIINDLVRLRQIERVNLREEKEVIMKSKIYVNQLQKEFDN